MSDFEKIDLDPSSNEARYERPDFAKVIFLDIAESYYIKKDIECHYQVTSSLIPHSSDWVGIYRVGWSSPRDYIHYVWSPKPKDYTEGEDCDNCVVFPATNLPEDDGEFYQFCYVTKSGLVRGASTPFQFRKSLADDFVAVEDFENDMMVIKTKTKVLEEDLFKAKEDREQLLKKIKHMEDEKEMLLSKMMLIDKSLKTSEENRKTAETAIKTVTEKTETLKKEVIDMTTAHDGLLEKVDVLSKEKATILDRLDENDKYIKDLQGKIKALINEKDSLSGKNKALLQEKKLLQDHFSSSEETTKGYLKEIFSLKNSIEELEARKTAHDTEVSTLSEEVDNQKKKILDIANESHMKKKEYNALKEKYESTRDMLDAAENCKKIFIEERSAFTETNKKLSNDLQHAKDEKHQLLMQLNRVSTEHGEMIMSINKDKQALENQLSERDQTIKRLELELVSLQNDVKNFEDQQMKEQDGSLFAMQTARTFLRDRHERMKKERKELQQKIEILLKEQAEWKDKEEEMRHEITDLKERISMCLEEYKLKSIECMTAQRKLKRARKSSEKETSSPQPSIEKENAKEDSLPSEIPNWQAALDANLLKQQKYKEMYQVEKEKSEMLQKFYFEEKEKMQRRISELEEQLKRESMMNGDTGLVPCVTECINNEMEFSNPYESMPKVQPVNVVASSIKPVPLLFSNPYDASGKANVERTAEENQTEVKVNADEDVFGSLGSDQDSSESESATSPPVAMPVPLKPLPAPMQPEVLPSAKLAAVKAANGLSRSSSCSNESSDVEQEEKESFGLAGLDPVEAIQNDEDEDERFHDAAGYPQKLCPVCNVTFSSDISTKEFEMHVDSHFARKCPVCDKSFTKLNDEESINVHVNEHFND